jgi:hypothetical protein
MHRRAGTQKRTPLSLGPGSAAHHAARAARCAASGARATHPVPLPIQFSNSNIQIRVHVPAAPCARGFAMNPPKKNQRAWGTPGARCTRSPVCKVESTRVLTADTPEHPAFPHAMVLTVSFVLSLVTGLDCHHRRRNQAPPRARLGKGAFRRLDASVGASGPYDFAVRRPHHSSARRLIAHRLVACPAITYPRLMSPRPPHPAPRP